MQKYKCYKMLMPAVMPAMVSHAPLTVVYAKLSYSLFPTFYQGFEPRGTELSNRIVARDNWKKAFDDGTLQWTRPSPHQQNVHLATSEHQPGKYLTAAKRNRRSLSGPPMCPFPPYDSMVFVFKTSDSKNNLFDANRLRSMCAMEQKVVRERPGFELVCSSVYDESSYTCCASWSLGNYVALLNNRESCKDVTDEDVKNVKRLLSNCSLYFFDQILKDNCFSYSRPSGNVTIDPSCESVPRKCVEHNAVYNIFQYLTDNEFMSSSGDAFLKYSSILIPVRFSPLFYEDVYESSLKGDLPTLQDVEMAGFEFWNFKFDKFSERLIAEVIFPALAMIVVFAIMWGFLESFILTFCGLFCIIYAIGLAYFFYVVVFNLKFFPFLNLTAFIFLVGIGADDAFVYYGIWKQTKTANPHANIMQLTLKTLRYAALSMLVTSLTTASAFFAGVSSTITAIKCFGIFAGTSILLNYLLMITYFPSCVALHERWVLKYAGGQSQEPSPPFEKAPKAVTPITEAQEMSKANRDEMVGSGCSSEESTDICILQIIDFPCSLLVAVHRFFQRASSKVFDHWLPLAIIRFHWLWIVLFVCLTVGFLCASFVEPGLQLPDSRDFQVFSSSNPLEQYSLKYKSFFRFEQKGGRMSIELFWGVKPVDNGNYLDADNKGTLEFDEEFDNLFSPDGQRFLQALCSSAEAQPFFAGFAHAGKCPIDEFIRLCSSGLNPCCGNYTNFPFPAEVTERCFLEYATHMLTGLFFDASSGKLRGFFMTIFVKQAFSTAFTPMDTFWKSTSSWVEREMAKAPPGLKNGWAITGAIDHYALQIGISEGTFSSMGISVAVSFGVMLLTTLNIFISIYAIITIIGIIAITVGSLVLAGWQLNILESIVMSVAVGLSIDFTMHYGVAYELSPEKTHRGNRVRYSLMHIGSAITVAALTTFLTGTVPFVIHLSKGVIVP